MKRLRELFEKEINPYSVSDKVTFRNVDETLTLYVRSSATALVASLRDAQVALKELDQGSTEDERENAARIFARSVFGDEQGDSLVEFYNDPLAVMSAVGKYFETRLAKKITKAQKR